MELQKTAQLHHCEGAHHDGGSHPPRSIPSPQTDKIHSLLLYCHPSVIPSLNYQHRPAFEGGGEDFIHLQLCLRSMSGITQHHLQNSFFSTPSCIIFPKPEAVPAGGGRGLEPSPALHLHKQDSGTYPFVRRFEGAQPFTKITSLPCVLTFWKTQP